MAKATLIAGLLSVALLQGCSTVEADSDGIAIRHSAENRILIDRTAEKHCAQFGKKAVRVQRSPQESTYYFNTVTTKYRCVVDG